MCESVVTFIRNAPRARRKPKRSHKAQDIPTQARHARKRKEDSKHSHHTSHTITSIAALTARAVKRAPRSQTRTRVASLKERERVWNRATTSPDRRVDCGGHTEHTRTHKEHGRAAREVDHRLLSHPSPPNHVNAWHGTHPCTLSPNADICFITGVSHKHEGRESVRANAN